METEGWVGREQTVTKVQKMNRNQQHFHLLEEKKWQVTQHVKLQ